MWCSYTVDFLVCSRQEGQDNVLCRKMETTVDNHTKPIKTFSENQVLYVFSHFVRSRKSNLYKWPESRNETIQGEQTGLRGAENGSYSGEVSSQYIRHLYENNDLIELSTLLAEYMLMKKMYICIDIFHWFICMYICNIYIFLMSNKVKVCLYW